MKRFQIKSNLLQMIIRSWPPFNYHLVSLRWLQTRRRVSNWICEFEMGERKKNAEVRSRIVIQARSRLILLLAGDDIFCYYAFDLSKRGILVTEWTIGWVSFAIKCKVIIQKVSPSFILVTWIWQILLTSLA